MQNRHGHRFDDAMTATPPIAEFKVRPGFDATARPLIEFLGDHRAPGFPSVLDALRDHLPAFEADGHSPVPDDVVWQCRFDGGAFELCEDWAGLFIHAGAKHDRVIEAVAGALVRSGRFRRRPAADTRPPRHPGDAAPGPMNVN